MRFTTAFLTSLACCLTMLSGPATAGDPSAGKSSYSLFDPTPDSALRSFIPDRPLNSISPFTIDAGRLQVESDVLDFSQSSDRRTTTGTLESLDPEVRLGLTQSLEFDLLTAGLLSDQTTANRTGRVTSHDIGTGAVTLQARYNFFGNEGGTYALALAPFVSIPSGDRHFGIQRVDGGIIAPLSINLPSDFQLVLETEIQAMRNGTGPAFASFTNIANLSHAVPGVDHLTASVEFTSVVNADRLTPDTYTAEAALAYLVTPTTQVDLGGFVGLNRAAPDFQISAGVAHRF
ncbi:transporter [Lichenibacterium minor]|uniref:Transporter n=1 Tax=Lichenibacterium minor TaxID=2316528 RepID=A0A4Q2U335_9HYPH|nr:transporter [Lichenibacterium minor]